MSDHAATTETKSGFESTTVWSLISLAVGLFGPEAGLTEEDAKTLAMAGLVIIGVIGRARAGSVTFNPVVIWRRLLGAVRSRI